MNKHAITMMIRMDSLEDGRFQKTFELVNGGLNLLDSNGDLWYLIDRDGTHVVYAKDQRRFEDCDDFNGEGH